MGSLKKNWKEENMNMGFVLLMVSMTALWVVVALVIQPSAVGYIGIVGLFSSIQWMPYLMALIYYNGMYKKLAYAPLTAKTHPWVQRAMVAHNNALENFMLFFASIVFAKMAGVADVDINFWCMFYFICRCYYFAFTLAPPIFMMKTAFWMMGWVATTIIFVKGIAATKMNDFSM